MFGAIQSAFQIPELKRRIFWTLGILVVYRIGGHIPTPGVDGGALASFFESQTSGTIFELYDLFAGGNFSKATIFALGIMPYISASIILQLFSAVIPYFERLQKEGEEGRKRITQYTRYSTVGLAAVQAIGIAFFLESLNNQVPGTVVEHTGLGFRALTVLTLTTGTMFVMWLGEMITERGIGNGISLIIMIGIVSQFPYDILNTIRSAQQGTLNPLFLVFLAVGMFAITMFVVWVNNAHRRVPVQYARKMVGRKMVGGQSTHLPLRVITAGVIPIIFAQSIIIAPGTLGTFFPDSDLVQRFVGLFQPGGASYLAAYAALIIFFTYFYTAITFNPVDLAENMKKSGGFVPGIQPGKHTADYLDKILLRITLPGALFLALIAVLPDILIYRAGVPFYFGGTSLLIIVSVCLDTLKQIESHLLMRHYDGFMKRGRLKAQGMRTR